MIQKVRVDFRLVHGQIIHSWLKAVNADTICILDDDLLCNPLKKQMLQSCTPSFVHLEIYAMQEGLQALMQKSNQKKRYLLLASTIHGGIDICERLGVHTLNIGETLYDPAKRKLANSVYADAGEIERMNAYLAAGNSIEMQQLSNSKKLVFHERRQIV